MTSYAFVTLDIRSPEHLAAYRERAGAALARHGGEVLQASREPAILEGDGHLPDMVAVLGFPDRDAALAWISDGDLADIHDLRRGSGESTILLL